ncbi:FAD-dependent oxidoreductase, partial [Aestuariivirga sp.]|uniref:FAD-dependent oxidoreductase n=1 Tax=Aestuariivirga sp. TaxID=2650926 RepID=UPI003782E1F7
MAVESSFDAVIVGAGHNGLATAVHLARHGWKVGVFEAKDEAGGAVKTRELTLPGFRHDVAAMNLSLFAGSPFLREHGAALSRHGLAFAPAA